LQQYQTGLMNQDDAFAAVLAITGQVLTARPEDANARAMRLFVQAVPNTAESNPIALSDAVLELGEIVDENPREYQPRVLLSALLLGMQQSDKALQLQLEALEDDPYNARILFEIGSIYLKLDQLQEARSALQRSLDIEPLQPNAYIQLGFASLHSGDGVDYLQQSLKAMEVDPRDHEIPGFIAVFLYQLGLIDEADDFRDRVVAIAPTSAIAYRIELLRAIHAESKDASIAVARKAIEDNVESRNFAYGGAVQHLLRTATQNGTVDAETAYLEQHAPGLLDIDAAVVPMRNLMAQQLALDAWYTTLTHDELQRRIARIREIATSYGVDLLQDPRTRVGVMALEGNVSDAVELALADVFALPVLTDQNWRARYSQDQFAEFVADPRIQAAMQKWEAEEAAVRDSVRSYLLDLSSSS